MLNLFKQFWLYDDVVYFKIKTVLILVWFFVICTIPNFKTDQAIRSSENYLFFTKK